MSVAVPLVRGAGLDDIEDTGLPHDTYFGRNKKNILSALPVDTHPVH